VNTALKATDSTFKPQKSHPERRNNFKEAR